MYASRLPSYLRETLTFYFLINITAMILAYIAHDKKVKKNEYLVSVITVKH